MLRVLGAWWSSPGTQMTHWRRGPGFTFGHFLPQFIPCHGKDKAYGKKFGRWKSIQKGAHGCVCVCACVCVLCVCMCACWGILVTLMAFISGQWNAAKTFSLLSCCSYTDTPMNAHSTYIPCKENCYSCCMSIQWGSSSVLSQYLNFFFFKIQEKAQMYPRECERMRRSWQQLPPLCVCSLKGLQGAMKEKSVRQPGELRAGCRVHTGVRASEPSS